MSKKKRKIKYVEVSENDYPSKEKIWDKQYECRNFELSNFWQKSAFLFGFLSVCFAGYGALVLQVVDKEIDINKLSYIYQYMCGISFLGIVLSIVWIYMMKGSKAWYEVYEKSIYKIEGEIFKKSKLKYREGAFADKMRKNFTSNFTTFKGGSFSPSKINILIGWVMLIIWIICCGISLFNLLQHICFRDILNILMQKSNTIKSLIFLVNCVVLVTACIIYAIKPFIASSTLSSKERNINLGYFIIGLILCIIIICICVSYDFLKCFAPLIPIIIYWMYKIKTTNK